MEEARAWMAALSPHIICNHSATDDEWLGKRVGLMTGSKIPGILGVGYNGPLDMLREFKSPGESVPVEKYSPLWCKMRIGSLAEKPIGETAYADPGRPFCYEPIADVPRLIRHPDYAWAACSPDGLAIGSGGEKILIEIKHHKMSMKKSYETDSGGELVPSKFEAQNLWNQFCTGADVGLMVSWFGEYVLFRVVERDEAVIESMRERAELFLEAVKTDNPLLMMQVIEDAEAMNKAMGELFQRSTGAEFSIDDPELDAAIAECIDVRKRISELKVLKSGLEVKIKSAVGTAKKVHTSRYNVTWSAKQGRDKLDREGLAEKYPEIVKEFTQKGLPHRSGLFLTQRKEK